MNRRPQAHEPPARGSAAPRKQFDPGDAVLVTNGMSKGQLGKVVGRWEPLGGIPHWRVDLPDCANRIIRADYLEPAT